MNNNKASAIKLRKKGKSYNEISKTVGVPKSTLSYWLKNIELSKETKKQIIDHSQLIWSQNITKYNKNRSVQIKKIHLSNQEKASSEIKKISLRELKLIGIALYWAEGGKRGNRFEFTNSDPALIKMMLDFLEQICTIKIHEIKAQINIHKGIDANQALIYWRSVTKLPTNNFYKIMYYNNVASKKKRQKNRLPFGTIQLRIYNTKFFNEIMGWIKGFERIAN